MKSHKKRKASKVSYKTHRKRKPVAREDFQKLYRERYFL